MAAAKGREREKKRREELFLVVARDLLLEEGYHGITMARVAEITGFAKATVYKRFPCKEELIVELGSRCRQRWLSMVERAMQFEGRPRERMVAVGEAAEHYARLYPDNLRVLEIIRTEAVLQKVSGELRTRMRAYNLRQLNILVEIIREAIAQEDLVVSGKSAPQEIAFSLMAMVLGGYSAILGQTPLAEAGIVDAFGGIARGCHFLMDGCGWRPLSTEYDYDAVSLRVRKTIFAEEAERVYREQAAQKDLHPSARVQWS